MSKQIKNSRFVLSSFDVFLKFLLLFVCFKIIEIIAKLYLKKKYLRLHLHYIYFPLNTLRRKSLQQFLFWIKEPQHSLCKYFLPFHLLLSLSIIFIDSCLFVSFLVMEYILSNKLLLFYDSCRMARLPPTFPSCPRIRWLPHMSSGRPVMPVTVA